MTPENLVYWLKGFIELTETETISPAQWQVIKDHVDLVLNKQTPFRNLITTPAKSIEILNNKITC